MPKSSWSVVVKSISIHTLAAIARLVRQEILKTYLPESCIATSRYLLQALLELGIDAKPAPLRLLVMNQPYVLNKLRLGRFPNQKELAAWSQFDNSCSIGIGFGENTAAEHWTGHLAVLVRIADTLLLVDPSIDQVNRPDRFIQIECPLIAPVPSEFLHLPELGVIVEQNNCALLYISVPGNTGFLQTPAWNRNFSTEKVLDQVKLFRAI